MPRPWFVGRGSLLTASEFADVDVLARLLVTGPDIIFRSVPVEAHSRDAIGAPRVLYFQEYFLQPKRKSFFFLPSAYRPLPYLVDLCCQHFFTSSSSTRFGERGVTERSSMASRSSRTRYGRIKGREGTMHVSNDGDVEPYGSARECRWPIAPYRFYLPSTIILSTG